MGPGLGVRSRATARLLPDAHPSWASGVLAALAAVAASTLLAYPLKTAGSALLVGVVYLPAILIVAAVWGFWLGILTSVLSGVAMDFFHLPPTGSFTVSNSHGWVALAGYTVVGALASYLAEVARERQRERDAILTSISQPIYVATHEGMISFANAAAVQVLGFEDPSELVGQNGHWLVHYKHPDGSPYPIEDCPLSRARDTGETLSVDQDWWVRKDGSMVAVSYTAAPIQTSAGYGLAVAFSDIGERVAAEQATREREVADARAAELAASEERQRAVLDSALDCVISIDARGRISYFNAAAERTFGYRSDEVIGRELAEVMVPPSVAGDHRRGFERHLETGEQRVIGRRIELNAMRADGSEFPVELAVTRVSFGGEPIFTGYLRDITERRLAEAELGAARRRLQVSAEEQAALRRVATRVAEGAPPGDVFAAVAAEVARLLGITRVVMCRYEPDNSATAIGAAGEHPFRPGTNWPLDGPSMLATVRTTGRPARIDDYSSLPGPVAHAVRTIDANAGVSAPIIVDGEVWGVVSVGADSPLPPDTEDRLTQFTDLVAVAISKTQASEELRLLVEEQSALRRVATLVAQAAPSGDVLAAVAAEVASVLDVPGVEISRCESDGTATVISAVGDHPFQAGTNWKLDGPSLTTEIKRTRRPARIDDYSDIPGSIGDAARAAGIHAAIGAPVVVDGKLWGVVSAGGVGVTVPPGAEARLAQFTELVATAISNSQAREDLQRLADEQASLRRLATLVAEGAEPRVVFDAVCEETGRLLDATTVNLANFTPDAINVTISGWSVRGVHGSPGTRLPLDGGINEIVFRTGRPGRCDTYEGAAGRLAEYLRQRGIRSEVGAPVVVEGQVWGVLIAGTDEPEPLPSGTEYRLSKFAELIATAVSNAQARQDLRRLVDEQGALRRIATLVADGAESQLVFDAVCEETGRVFGAATVNLVYFTPDDFHLAMAGWSLRGVHVPAGTLLPLEGDTIDTLVRRTGAPGRCDSYDKAQGEIAALLRQLGVRSEVGAPVVVDGRVWGALIAGTDEPEPLAPGTEHRLAGFAELIATAVSNTTARAELIASRARIVTAGDEQRRRVVRDLHDGAQQRLVHATITLQLAQSVGAAPPELGLLVGEALEDTRGAIEELRELAHGLHPAVLTARGLAAAVEELADRAPVPVRVEIPEQRYPAVVESAAYFIAAEALTNVAKYANASAARVAVTASGDSVVLTIEDDGAGGAVAKPGSGLSGLLDRVAALDGTLTVDSPPGLGTRIRAEVPVTTLASREPASLPADSGSERATTPIAAPD